MSRDLNESDDGNRGVPATSGTAEADGRERDAGGVSHRVPRPANADASAGTGPAAGMRARRRDTVPVPRISIEVVAGPITAVRAPIAVVGRYVGTPPAGASREFDRKLDCWLTRAHEFGMIGSRVGELFYMPLGHFRRPPAVGAACPPGSARPSGHVAGARSEGTQPDELAPDGLIVAGLGDPGRFGADDLGYLMANVTLAVKALGHDEFSTMLLGSHRREIPTDRAVRELVEGVADGLRRLPDGSGWPAIRVLLVERTEAQGREIEKALKELDKRLGEAAGVDLEVLPRDRSGLIRGGTGGCDPPPADLPPEERATRVTVIRPTDAEEGAVLTLEYAAMAESAVVPVRRVTLQRYFTDRLSEKLPACEATSDQERFGRLLASYLVPEEFRALVEAGDPLTLILDADAAAYPWEMGAYRAYGRTSFLGIDLKLTRQFRTPLSSAPGLAPPLNHSLRVLVVADPAPGGYGLPGARAEGLAVLRALAEVDAAWDGELDLRVDVRVGPPEDWASGGIAPCRREIEEIGRRRPGLLTVGDCDPVDLLALLLNEHYDVVHYAGHGVFEPQARRAGWVLREDCVLSAAEIFQARHVPRLVFANACHSGRVAGGEAAGEAAVRRAQVSLAEAFFGRGVENYVGTGWAVADAAAGRFARRFYEAALGLGREAGPATLGDAIADARREIFDAGSTWAAYHHYGRANAKLLAVPNDELAGAGD